ncbi:double-strand break repair protein MRE11-like [Littorina saxatilis]
MATDNPIPNHHEDTSIFRILIATDIHLGFKHQDPVRGHDSMGTFEEVLQLAREHRADFVLLGGDLFHENRPPRAVMHGCLQLLKKYCVGEEPKTFQVIDTERDEAGPCGTDVAVSTASFSESDTSLTTNKTKALLLSTSSSPDPLTPPASGFSVSSSFAQTTTSSKPSNMNISMPVFSIHGNHDEPTGPLNLSAMDIVECAGLVHYFGKTTSVSEIEVKPVLLKKGTTQLALYGIGSIRSDKLHQMYVTNKVTMEPPQQDNAEDWFNILVLHQNRVQRAHQTHVKESFIHDFIDLAIWGHEHESLMKPTPVAEGRKTKILQPGSTIATQFKQSETKQKHAALLTVCGREFHLEPLRLETVRKMFIVDLIPRLMHGETEDDEVNRLMQDCQNKVEKLLERQRGPGQPHEPLIRIKVQHEKFFYKTFSATRFGTPFVGRVANPHNIVVFGRKGSDPESDLSDLAQPHKSEFPMLTLEDLLLKELQKEDLPPQIVLKKKVLAAMRDYVHLEKSGAISTIVKEQLESVQKKIKSSEHLLSTTESLMDWIDEAIRTHREGIEGTTACAEEATVIQAVAHAASAG